MDLSEQINRTYLAAQKMYYSFYFHHSITYPRIYLDNFFKEVEELKELIKIEENEAETNTNS